MGIAGRTGQASAGGPIGAMIFLHLALLSGAAARSWFPHRPDFAVDKFAVYQIDGFADGAARLASLSKPLMDGRVFISPIDVLVLLQVRNAASQTKQIRDTKMEGFIAGEWQPLCRVRLAPLRDAASRRDC
jgi:hypothetical protein